MKKGNNKKILSSRGKRQIYFLGVFVFLLSGIVLTRLFVLQVFSCDLYRALAENQHKLVEKLIPRRGEIFLKEDNGYYPLAVNRDLPMAYAVPKEIEEKERAVKELALILSLDESFLKEKIFRENDLYEILKRKLSEEEVEKIKALNIKGIYLSSESSRYYPGGKLLSQTVGFVGSDGKEYRGMYGLEAFWEDELRGEAGILSQEKDVMGRWISIKDRQFQPAKNGADFFLTIDRSVQYETEKILKETVEKHKADGGSIVVMDPQTGKILAMATYPDFNPNEYFKEKDMSIFFNFAVNFSYEPGSVFKPITMAIGIEEGKVEPDTVYTDTGSVLEAGYEIKNSEEKVYGQRTMTQVLEESINTGVIFVEKLVGNKKFAEGVAKFGFGKKTGIELPMEAEGNLNNLKEFKKDIQFFTASFGQGIMVTPLQLASAYSVFANGGKLMKPQIVEKIKRGDEEEIIHPVEIRKVISRSTAEKISQMLRSVVINGHGKRADVAGYSVVGKTGTAQVPKKNGGGYEEGITIGSFVGFAPMENARFTVAVKINNPKDVQWAESTAAPAFSQLMEFLLKYYKIEPTEKMVNNK